MDAYNLLELWDLEQQSKDQFQQQSEQQQQLGSRQIVVIL